MYFIWCQLMENDWDIIGCAKIRFFIEGAFFRGMFLGEGMMGRPDAWGHRALGVWVGGRGGLHVHAAVDLDDLAGDVG